MRRPGRPEEGRDDPDDRIDARPVLLVLRALGLGDLLTGVPALRGLRRAYPEHRLVLAAPSPLRPLLPLIGGVDALLDVSGPGPVPLHAPDIAVNLHGRGPESTAALLRTAPARLLSHAPPNRTGLRAMRLMREIRGVRGPRWREDVHEVRRWCDMLAWFGVPADPADLDIAAPPETAREAEAPVVIHPGAAYPARRWPPERYAEVAAALRRAGQRVVVTGGGQERVLARRVAAMAGLTDEAVLAGRTGLGDLARVVARARLLICGDTGVAHLATALRTPSVVLFGPVSPAQWGPPPDRREHIVLWAGRTGDPHGARPDPGLLDIDARQVTDAALSLLEVGIT